MKTYREQLDIAEREGLSIFDLTCGQEVKDALLEVGAPELDKEFDAINSEFKAEMYLTAREKRYKTVAEKAENVANTYKVELERARTKPPVEKIVTKR